MQFAKWIDGFAPADPRRRILDQGSVWVPSFACLAWVESTLPFWTIPFCWGVL